MITGGNEDRNGINLGGMDYGSYVADAVKAFWTTKKNQFTASGDTSNRGAVVAGKQMDGFVHLLRSVAVAAGVPAECVITDNNYLPGYFRSSKNWDMLIIAPSGELVAAVELKSQVGSYGNNFNNRAEEAIGSAVDFWAACRDGQFPCRQTPWLGWMMVVGLDEASQRAVRNQEPHFPVRYEFCGASYIDRYAILCKKMVFERHYTSAALLCTSGEDHYEDVADEISVSTFLSSFMKYLKGVASEFK